jgi:hypothetical protein
MLNITNKNWVSTGEFISFMAFITTIVLASIFPNSLNIFATLLTDPLPSTAY